MAALLPASIYLARAIKQLKHIDIIWGIGPWTLAGALLKKTYPSTPLYAEYFLSMRHEHLTTPLRFIIDVLYTPLERYLLKKSDRIITHYQSTEKILTHDFYIHPSRFYRMPYAIDTIPVAHHTSSTTPLLLTVCRQDFRKGIHILLAAYEMLERKHINFNAVIIGGGRLLAHNKHLIHHMKLTRITFTGPVKDMRPYMARAYAFILPSLEEGGGSIALLEAMAARLPIIATNIDGIPEDIENGKSGILVEPNNPHALARAIETIITDPQRAHLLGRNAQDQYRNKYNEPTVTKALRTILTAGAQ
jgi:glycosyltransferase involved in cell wall biosynthesis